MGHSISAILLQGDFDPDKAAKFDLRSIAMEFGIKLFPLDSYYCDYWAEKLGITGFVSDRPILNCKVVHHMMNTIASEPLFAIIETDYFGGAGDQAAAVYKGRSELLKPTIASEGPINKALKALGVMARQPLDEFDTIGLGKYRDFDSWFEAYWHAAT